ncbi:hypothetical protein CPC08DRAFT_769807 [Agrocybe pediades]|nr:hypothetical protein CPC08DRAFT_769807 [Agrocybe pediades]
MKKISAEAEVQTDTVPLSSKKPIHTPLVSQGDDLHGIVAPAIEQVAVHLHPIVYRSVIARRAEVQEWIGIWGGVDKWDETLDLLVTQMRGKGREHLSKLVKSIWRHELIGQRILRTLLHLEGDLPKSVMAVKILWSHHQEQIIAMVQGLTTLRLKIAFFRMSTKESGSFGDIHSEAVSLLMESGESGVALPSSQLNVASPANDQGMGTDVGMESESEVEEGLLIE